MSELITLFLKVPRGNEYTPEAAQTFLSALTQLNSLSVWDRLMGKRPQALALEIAFVSQQIRFLITADAELAPFIEAQIQSNYPLVIVEKVEDPQTGPLYVQTLKLTKGNYYPLVTYSAFQDVDPLSSVLSVLSKADPSELIIIQFALEAISGSWQAAIHKTLEAGIKDKEGNRSPLPDEAIIREKISFPGFGVTMRIAARQKSTLSTLVNAFGVFNKIGGNSISVKRASLFSKDDSLKGLISRRVAGRDILNIARARHSLALAKRENKSKLHCLGQRSFIRAS